MPEIVETHLSFFETEIEFVEPNLKIWLDRIAIIEAVYKALRPWDITIDNVEVLTEGSPSQQGVRFKVPQKKASFFFSAAACKFARDSTSWETADETIQILDAALKAFQAHSGTEFKTFKTGVALHFRPKAKTFMEVLRPVVPAPMAALESDACTSMAVIVKWPGRRVTIDGSAQIANGLFVRYERDFPGNISYEDMAKQLYADEMQICKMLDVVEE
jgi:hypothetical protein